MHKITLLAVFLCIGISESYKILLVFPFPYVSHSILGKAFVNTLLKAGHEVTYLTPTPLKETNPNLRQIKVESYNFDGITLKCFIEKRDERKLEEIFEKLMNISYSAVSNPDVQKLMNDSKESFDLVILERMGNDVYSGFSAVFNCPYIWFFSYEYAYEMMRLIHETPNPAYATNMRTHNVPPFNFLQRVQELLHVITTEVQRILYTDSIEMRAYRELFGPALTKRGRTLPPYDQLRYNASLLFSNSHLTIRYREETPQSYKAIGGFHITTPEPLPEEYSTIMENGNGVILFSTGSYLKAEDLPTSLKRQLLTMFSELNYTVLWKINEQFEDLPKNVRTFSWIPNQSILAHPKCVLFITHGGMLSLIEAVHYGVPVIGVPVYGDQEVNVKTVVNRGIGRMVLMTLALAGDLKAAIKDVLENSRYKENVMNLSWIFHNRPVTPAQELLHWVEHVIATRGAPHLRSPALLTPWYQKYYVDFAAVLLVVGLVMCFAVSRLVKYLGKMLNMILIRLKGSGKCIKVG